MGCAVHSPSAERPGAMADRCAPTSPPLATPYQWRGPAATALIECYPHVALLELLKRDYRVPYKVSRSASTGN